MATYTIGSDAGDDYTTWALYHAAHTDAAGDIISFRRGETFRARINLPASGTSANRITYTAHGTGDRPIIAAADLVTTWGDEGGNVWSATLNREPTQVYMDGTIGVNDLTPDAEFDWYWNANTLYIYSTSNPDTAYTDPGVEASNAGYSFYNNGYDYITFEHLHIKFGETLPIFLTNGSDYNIVNDCIVECGKTNGLEIKNSTDVSVHDSTLRNNPSDGVWSNISTNTSIYSNTFTNNGFGSSGDRNAIGIWNSPGASVYQNTITHSSTQDAIECGSNDDSTTLSVYRNWIDCSGGTGVGILCMNGEYDVYYNILIGNTSNEGILLASDNEDYLVANVYNNVLYGWDESIECYDNNNAVTADTAIVIKNNISSNINTRHIRVEDNIDAKTTLDYNCYDSDTGTQYQWADTDYNFADYKTNSSQDANAVQADPSFTVAGSDFTLAVGSPCINAGTDVSLTTDYPGNIVGALPDIGAYEFQMSIGGSLHFTLDLTQR